VALLLPSRGEIAGVYESARLLGEKEGPPQVYPILRLLQPASLHPSYLDILSESGVLC
jgi:hypothetical protein